MLHLRLFDAILETKPMICMKIMLDTIIIEREFLYMTAIRQEAIQMLERVPEDKLSFVIQIMQGVNGLIEAPEKSEKKVKDLDQFIMETTQRGQDADRYIRELRDNDRI